MNNRGRNIIKAMIVPYKHVVVYRRPLRDERKGILDLILRESKYWTPYESTGDGEYLINAKQKLIYNDEIDKLEFIWVKMNKKFRYSIIDISWR